MACEMVSWKRFLKWVSKHLVNKWQSRKESKFALFHWQDSLQCATDCCYHTSRDVVVWRNRWMLVEHKNGCSCICWHNVCLLSLMFTWSEVYHSVVIRFVLMWNLYPPADHEAEIWRHMSLWHNVMFTMHVQRLTSAFFKISSFINDSPHFVLIFIKFYPHFTRATSIALDRGVYPP